MGHIAFFYTLYSIPETITLLIMSPLGNHYSDYTPTSSKIIVIPILPP